MALLRIHHEELLRAARHSAGDAPLHASDAHILEEKSYITSFSTECAGIGNRRQRRRAMLLHVAVAKPPFLHDATAHQRRL